MKRYLLTVAAVALLGCGAMQAQDATKTVKGVVIDPNGNPVPGAEIRATRGVEITNSDADGSYELNVPAKQKSVTISYPGYKTRKVRLDGTPYYVTEFQLAGKRRADGFFDLVGGPTIVAGSTGFETSDVQGHLGLMFGNIVTKWGWYMKLMLRVGGKVDLPDWYPESTIEENLCLMPMLNVGVVHRFTPLATVFGGIGFGINPVANYEGSTNYYDWSSYSVDVKLVPTLEVGGMINITKNLNCVVGLTYMFPAKGTDEDMLPGYILGKNSGWVTPFVGIGYTITRWR